MKMLSWPIKIDNIIHAVGRVHICKGCIYSFRMSGNHEQCAFCKTQRKGKTEEKEVKEMMKQVKAKDASAMYHLARYYQRDGGLLQDRPKALELYARAAQLGSCRAHFSLGTEYDLGGD
jgi:TPR repeat protein